MKKILFKGCGTAIVTPFDENGVNFKEFEKLIEFQISEGVDALIVCGTTGESSTMSLDERKRTIEFAIKIANKRVPIIAGTGGNCTQSVIDFTKWAESVGVDGALIVTPYYNKTTQSGLIAHYSAIANSTKLPIILYNVPSRTGVSIRPETYLELSKHHNIVAVKEANGDISSIAKTISLCGDNLAVYSGNDDQIIPILSLGGLGVISVFANVCPLECHEINQKYFDGKLSEARDLFLKANDLMNMLFCDVNPIPVKEAMSLLGFDCGNCRLPLVSLSAKNKENLITAMKNFGLINR